MKLVRAAKFGYIFTSIMSILTGVALLIWPGISSVTICRVMGVVIMISGVSKLFGYFSDDLYRLAFQFDLALGILTILFGLLMFLFPAQFSLALVTAVAVYVIVNGIFTVQTAVEAKRFGLSRWWLLLLGGVLSGFAGALLLLNPSESVVVLAWLLGLAFITDGIQNLLVAALTIRIRKNLQ